MDNLKVAIDARFKFGGFSGGIESNLFSLWKALGELEGPEIYNLVCFPENEDIFKNNSNENQKIVPYRQKQLKNCIKKLFGEKWIQYWGVCQKKWLSVSTSINKEMVPPGWVQYSNGFFEQLDVSLVHVYYQSFIKTKLPVVFNPHDLQHEHFPEFFSYEDLSRRKYVYSSACKNAAGVVVGSRYTKNDVIASYNVEPQKIYVIPTAPALPSHKPFSIDFLESIQNKFDIHKPFVLYPAVTWEHKNHLRLLAAIVNLRGEGIKINLICTGAKKEPGWSKISNFIKSHDLENQVKFLGYIDVQELQALYKLSQFVISASLFEQASGLMFEAWQEETPIASSNVTSIPDQAGNAAYLFDPLDINSIANSIRNMSTEIDLRETLIRNGRKRLLDFSWSRTAKAYRALYRKISNSSMTEEDVALLNWNWMLTNRLNQCK